MLQVQAQADTKNLDALKGEVKELQTAVKEREGQLGGLRNVATGTRCATFSPDTCHDR